MFTRTFHMSFDLASNNWGENSFRGESNVVRLGEIQSTEFIVTIMNNGEPVDLKEVVFGFELRNYADKIIIDKNQKNFRAGAEKNEFIYRADDRIYGFNGSAHLCYFTLESGGNKVSTPKFSVYSDADVQSGADGLQEHYVSVIDGLIETNKGAMEEAKKIQDMIEKNQVVKKTGDKMTGNLHLEVGTSGDRRVAWTKDDNLQWGLTSNATNLKMFNWKDNKTVFDYTAGTDTLNVNSNTNLLKKTGDTITGDLQFDIATSSKVMRWVDGAKSVSGVSAGKSGADYNTTLFDNINNQNVWQYNSGTKSLNILSNTNLLKKSGGTMEGELVFPSNKNLIFRTNGGQDKATMAVDGNGNFFAWNSPGNRYLWKLDGTTGRLDVLADNLLAKDGDTAGNLSVTGALEMRATDPMQFRPQGKTWWLLNTSQEGFKLIPSGTVGQTDWQWGKAFWINKDGTVRQGADTNWDKLPLQANIVEIDGGCYGKRSGQTVTLTLNYKATSLVSDRVLQLPNTFVPQRDLRRHIITGTGKVTQLLISNNGIVYCSALNDDIRETITYVI